MGRKLPSAVVGSVLMTRLSISRTLASIPQALHLRRPTQTGVELKIAELGVR